MERFQQRLFFGSIAFVAVLVAIYFSYYPAFRPIYTLIASGIVGMSIWEYYQLARAKGYEPHEKIGIGCSILYIFTLFLNTQIGIQPIPLVVLWLTLIGAFLYDFIKGKEPIVNLAITLFAIVYLTIPLGCLIDITFGFDQSSLQDGRYWVFYLLAVTKSTDIGAYFIGKTVGTKKLAPTISPNKTWEGAVGGFLVALLVSFAFHKADIPIQLSFSHSLILGCVISVFAQLGDLSESLLKRDAVIKDSNRLPGLGGMLDIVDSLVFTTPILCLYLNFLGG